MQSQLSNAGIYTDLSGLAKLRAQASNKSPEANKEVARQFEALFLQTMLKAMRQASQIGESMDGEQTRFYQEMYDKQIALDLARTGGVGLAAIIERQLGGQAAGATNPSVQVPPPAESRSVDPPVRHWRPDSQEAFIQDLWPHASASAKELGVSADVLIAQAALETGWGRNMILDRQGGNAFNLFGIKAGSHWQGEQVSIATLEYRDGLAQREKAAFRAYGSLQESMNDYVSFLKQNPRYQAALEQSGNDEAFLQELQKAGYATDPAYAAKISNIMKRESFMNAVSQARLQDHNGAQHSG